MQQNRKESGHYWYSGLVVAVVFVHRRHATSKSVSLSNRNSAYVFLFTTRGISSTVDSCSRERDSSFRGLCETLTRLRRSPQMNQKRVGWPDFFESKREYLAGVC